MIKYPGIDYTQRPTSYWDDPDALTAVLRNVTGSRRRALIRQSWHAGNLEELDPDLMTDVLDPGLRTVLGKIHPAFLSGEFLPPYQPMEREIARIELRSATGDVVSVRAKPAADRIRYRIVDEYDTRYAPGRASSREPLSLLELVALLDRSRHPAIAGPLPLAFNELNHTDLNRRAELLHFTRVISDLYPQLEAHYRQVFREWAR